MVQGWHVHVIMVVICTDGQGCANCKLRYHAALVCALNLWPKTHEGFFGHDNSNWFILAVISCGSNDSLPTGHQGCLQLPCSDSPMLHMLRLFTAHRLGYWPSSHCFARVLGLGLPKPAVYHYFASSEVPCWAECLQIHMCSSPV